MARSRNFSVYLLKTDFTYENALRSAGRLVQVDLNIENVLLYITPIEDKEPWWKDYWGIDNDALRQVFVGALAFLQVNDRIFVISFGSAYHNLKDEAYECDFGIRTTLNALDPEKIKSTDILIPESSKRQRMQIPIASNLFDFDFNKDESIVKRLTGMVKEEYRTLFRNVTGASSFRFSSSVSANELVGLCSRLLAIYERNDYEQSFPDFNNIKSVVDSTVILELDNSLLEAFREGGDNLVLSIPDIIDYSSNFKVKYKGAGLSMADFDDINISDYKEYLSNNSAEITECRIFHRHNLEIRDENDVLLNSYSIYKSFLFDCQLNGNTYHLCEGKWYEVNSDFVNRINNYLDTVFMEDHRFLIPCDRNNEKEYNESIATNCLNTVVCLDRCNIAPQGSTSIEPCDLIAVNENESKIELIHNKFSTRSTNLSHLFNQGLNAVVLLLENDESKNKLKQLIENRNNFVSLIDNNQYCVTYGIITNKSPERKSENLPLFSRISLLRCVRHFRLMNIPCCVFYIKDNRN